MNSNLLDNCKITRLSNAAVAGTTDIVGSRVDMAGFDSVCFIALLGEVLDTAVLELQVKQNTVDHATVPTPVEVTADDVQHTATATDADNKILAVTIHRHNPALGQYLFPVLVRGTANVVCDGIIAIQYNGRGLPMTQPASVLDSGFRYVK